MVLTCTALVGGCADTIGGTPTSSRTTSATEVAGLPVTDGPSGPKNQAPEPDQPVAGTDHGTTDELARNAVADVEDFWADAFPATFDGASFDPVSRLVSYDSRAPRGVRLCGADTKGLANAFYCPTDDLIAWDRGDLLPQLSAEFGPMAPVAVLAHEMGHAVQKRAGTAGPDDPVIVLEQQADCYTGSYFRHVAEGSSEHFEISTGNGLNQVLGVLDHIRDVPGTSDFRVQDAHGSAFDRVTAFQFGFAEGPERCTRMDFADVAERTTQFEFWKDGQDEDLPVDRESVDAVVTSLREVFVETGAEPPVITTAPADCPGRTTTSPAAYCPETNTVSLDLDELREIGAPPEPGDPTAGRGDFAAYAQIASRYALSVQQAAGLPLDDPAAGLRTACLVGSWSGLLLEDPIGQRNPVGRLRIAPGDVDEGVAAMLTEDSLVAADVTGAQAPAGFARVEAFRVGFQDGFSPCTTNYV
ncbi:neutral zinc metallopeptidase [Saccharopolyspora montiporae]|uniref:neutral zinc metallopeptidase n=1 Tax=Saccharopolyspora montiporae TaxID=2781240 RepID=UPI00351CA30A